MSSLTRGAGFAQRNNNVTKLVPVYLGDISDNYPGQILDLSNCPIYSLNLPETQYIGGIYTVDLSDVDSNGSPISLIGNVSPSNGPFTEINMPVIGINININTPASIYPGQEFTIFFKNLPINQLLSNDRPPWMTICILQGGNSPIPYIFSPPAPGLVGTITQNLSTSITFKSDGSNFNITSSGPSGWLGGAAFAGLLEIYQSIAEFPL